MEHLVLGVAAFVFTVLAVATVCRRFGLNAPLALIAVGVAGSFLPFVPRVELEPEMIIVAALPPLLYAAAVQTSLVDFRRNISTIGWLSIGLVVFTTLGVGAVVHTLLDIPWAAAFAIGAVVAPPDAVAASAVARAIGLPREVVTILEGESLVNDATALVSLRTAITAMSAAVTLPHIVGDFLVAVVVGVLVGVAVSILIAACFKRIDDPIASTALTLVAPFAAFVPAEELHGSGVLAVVVLGLLLGHKSPIIQSGQTRLNERINWATVQFVLENAVFLLIGLQVRYIVADAQGTDLTAAQVAAVCAAALATVIVLRVLWIFATRLMIHLGPTKVHMPRNEALVISWAGMRGVVTLAAALTLPLETPYRSVLILIALAVTLGTLVLQGLTLPWLARRVGAYGPDPREDTLQEAMIYQRSVAAGLTEAAKVAQPGDEAVMAKLHKQADARVNAVWERLGSSRTDTEAPSEAWRRLRRAAIAGERAEVLRMRDAGLAEQEVLRHVLTVLDLEEASILHVDEKDAQLRDAPIRPITLPEPCDHLQSAPSWVEPATPGYCPECRTDGTDSVALRLCLTCGHVGCCDSSAGKHATRHYEQTGHPVMRSIEPGENWHWCYVHATVGVEQQA